MVDADDTLWHATHKGALSVLHRSAKLAHYDRSRVESLLQQKRHARGLGTDAFAAALRETALEMRLPSGAIVELEEHLRRSRHVSVEWLPWARGAIRALPIERKYVLTRGLHSEQQAKFHNSGAAAILDGCIVVPAKNTSFFRRLVRELGVPPTSVLVVGNSIKHDILPAARTGAMCVWFNPPSNDASADAVLPSGALSLVSWRTVFDVGRTLRGERS